MSAIEIMDPKMDAGMMCNRESKAIKVKLMLIYYILLFYSFINLSRNDRIVSVKN